MRTQTKCWMLLMLLLFCCVFYFCKFQFCFFFLIFMATKWWIASEKWNKNNNTAFEWNETKREKKKESQRTHESARTLCNCAYKNTNNLLLLLFLQWNRNGFYCLWYIFLQNIWMIYITGLASHPQFHPLTTISTHVHFAFASNTNKQTIFFVFRKSRHVYPKCNSVSTDKTKFHNNNKKKKSSTTTTQTNTNKCRCCNRCRQIHRHRYRHSSNTMAY